MTDAATGLVAEPVHYDAGQFGPWTWDEPSHGEHFRRCSYCGSIHPADLVAEPEWAAEWADRKYGWPHKFYADIVNRTPDRLYVVAATNRESGGFVHQDQLTDEQRAAAENDGRLHDPGSFRWFKFGTYSHHWVKFYTAHLADPQLDPTVKAAIEQRSGIAFTFVGTKVSWQVERR